MSDWLFEGKPIVYAALAVAGIALVMLWWQSRKRGLLIAAGVMVVLIAGYALLDRAVETDREQIRRKVQDMAAALTAQDMRRAFQYISDQFRTPRGTDKAALQALATTYTSSGLVTDIKVWDIHVASISREEGKALVRFSVAIKPARDDFMRCDAVFDHDAAQGWRMREFRLFNPFRDEEYPLPF